MQTARPFFWTTFRLPLSIPRTFAGFGCGLTVLLVAHKMAGVVDLARAFFRAVKPWHVGLACGAFLFFAVVLLVAGFSLLQDTQKASGQPTTLPAPADLPVPPEIATATATSPAEGLSFPPLPTATAQLQETKPPAIPHLSLMDVMGNLKYLPRTQEFACTSGPTEGPETFWTCWSPGNGSPLTRVVTVLGDDPGSISSVTVTARGLDDREAAAFFLYVLDLCLADNDPANPKAWVDQNISSGGSLFARSADLTIYGTKEERTLEIVAPGFSL